MLGYLQRCCLQELGKLNIGSRPSSRKKDGGIETLRAIPWIFAWTQTRFLLPVWLGLSEAIQYVQENKKIYLLKEMYEKWPFLKVSISGGTVGYPLNKNSSFMNNSDDNALGASNSCR